MNGPERPAKRRKVAGRKTPSKGNANATSKRHFVPLLNGSESAQCAGIREQLYERVWAATEARIHVSWNFGEDHREIFIHHDRSF